MFCIIRLDLLSNSKLDTKNADYCLFEFGSELKDQDKNSEFCLARKTHCLYFVGDHRETSV